MSYSLFPAESQSVSALRCDVMTGISSRYVLQTRNCYRLVGRSWATCWWWRDDRDTTRQNTTCKFLKFFSHRPRPFVHPPTHPSSRSVSQCCFTTIRRWGHCHLIRRLFILLLLLHFQRFFAAACFKAMGVAAAVAASATDDERQQLVLADSSFRSSSFALCVAIQNNNRQVVARSHCQVTKTDWWRRRLRACRSWYCARILLSKWAARLSSFTTDCMRPWPGPGFHVARPFRPSRPSVTDRYINGTLFVDVYVFFQVSTVVRHDVTK